MTKEEAFFRAVLKELEHARRAFPATHHLGLALTEEVGEVAKALLDESQSRVYAECVQVAAMALRVATEGDAALYYRRRNRHLGMPGDD